MDPDSKLTTILVCVIGGSLITVTIILIADLCVCYRKKHKAKKLKQSPVTDVIYEGAYTSGSFGKFGMPAAFYTKYTGTIDDQLRMNNLSTSGETRIVRGLEYEGHWSRGLPRTAAIPHPHGSNELWQQRSDTVPWYQRSMGRYKQSFNDSPPILRANLVERRSRTEERGVRSHVTELKPTSNVKTANYIYQQRDEGRVIESRLSNSSEDVYNSGSQVRLIPQDDRDRNNSRPSQNNKKAVRNAAEAERNRDVMNQERFRHSPTNPRRNLMSAEHSLPRVDQSGAALEPIRRDYIRPLPGVPALSTARDDQQFISRTRQSGHQVSQPSNPGYHGRDEIRYQPSQYLRTDPNWLNPPTSRGLDYEQGRFSGNRTNVEAVIESRSRQPTTQINNNTQIDEKTTIIRDAFKFLDDIDD